MSRFLDDVRIVEALNEPVDDSGSKGDVSETEYSPSESDSDSGMSSRIGMDLIVARSNYFSSNILPAMLYCTEQLIITIFVQKMTPPT
jgi:hypothetical protein